MGDKKVLLHLYDVTNSPDPNVNSTVLRINGIARSTLGIGGIFHGAVEVYGEEWSFGYCERGSGVFSCPPKSNPYYTYRETVDMGETKLSAKLAGQVIAEMSVKWPGASYDMLTRNCDHFCDELCDKLGVVGPIPAWVNRFARTGDSALELYNQVGQQLFSEAAPETSKKVGRDDVAKAADNLVKQAVKVGIFWANSSPPKAAEAVPLLSGFHDSFVASLLLLHACSSGAAATWHAAIRSAAESVVSAASALLDTALTTSNANQRAQRLPRQVGVLQSACTALKKLPGSNEAAVGRALVTVAASMKDVARELGEMVGRVGEERGEGGEKGEGEKTGEREEEWKANGGMGRKQQNEENEENSKEKDDDDDDEEEEEDDDDDEEEEEESLAEEERELARSGLCVCGAAEGVVRCLIYLVAAWPQHRDSWGQQQQAQPQQQQEQEEEQELREHQPKSADNGNASSSSGSVCSVSSSTGSMSSSQNSSGMLESVLRVCMAASEDVDEIGASLFPPQEPATIRMRALQLLFRARELKSLLPLPPAPGASEVLGGAGVAGDGAGGKVGSEGELGSGGDVEKKGVGKGGRSVSELHGIIGEMERDVAALLLIVGEENSGDEVVGKDGAKGAGEAKGKKQAKATGVTVTIERCSLED
ncbi:hypothetical protein CLOM_g4989 [Closterium sp. NIES-68]|nr:hypothetical protein CLOM_g4989 [Closterium sp. NIES-68]GJP61961.1 hypothetical protein CLOP_g19078 [Closterium sp. NIES-67]